MAKIKNLDEFKDKKTYKFLDDRVNYIEELIKQIDAIRTLPSEIEKSLSEHKVETFLLFRAFTELVFILYRSMFQKADWEDGFTWSEITPMAYHYTDEHLRLHSEIINYVDKVLAHQDIIGSCDRMRRADSSIQDPNRMDDYMVFNWSDHLANELIPLIILMKNAIKTAFHKKSPN